MSAEAIHAAARNGDPRHAGGWKNWTPLHLAAGDGREATARLLVEHRADPAARMRTGRHPRSWRAKADTPPSPSCWSDAVPDELCSAAARGDVDRVRWLLDAGADSEARIEDGNLGSATPLILAAFSSPENAPVVRLLIERGADVRAVSGAGQTALATAAEHGEPEICAALLDAGAPVDLRIAASLGDTARVRDLLDAGASVHDRDAYRGAPPLYFAAQQNHAEVIALLLDAGAALDDRNAAGDTALHVASSAGALAAVEALLARGADVRATGRGGDTPLHRACDEWWGAGAPIAGALIAAGASAEAHNDAGQTPAERALARNKPRVAAAISGA